MAKIALLAALAFLLFPLAWAEPSAWNGTIRVRADGSIEPSDAPLRRAGDVYQLLADIEAVGDGIVVEKAGAVLDGGGRAVRGSGSGKGVVLTNAPGAAVKGLVISGFEYGIFVNGSSGCLVAGNRVVGGRVGIGLWSSLNCNVESNVVEGSMVGVFLEGSGGASIVNNELVGTGLYVRRSYGNRVTGNSVNGKPLIYLEGVSGGEVAGSAGQVVLVKCRDLRVTGLSIANTSVGVLLSECEGVKLIKVFTANCTIGIDIWNSTRCKVALSGASGCEVGLRLTHSKENTIDFFEGASNSFGIFLDSSAGNRISRCSIKGCKQVGIALRLSSGNTFETCIVASNARGISLYRSDENLFKGNAVWRNGCGVAINASSGNLLFDNEFVENRVHALLMDAGSNSWDDGSRGNFWSDLWEAAKSGKLLGPYSVGEGNVDRHPLPASSLLVPVEVRTPIGYAEGGGWYLRNTTVKVKVWPSNLLFLVFDRWEDDKGRTLDATPEAQLTVIEPVELKAVWRIEYRTVAITIVAGVLAFYAWKRASKAR
jgi:parallel beta-helix repeat protein